MKKLDANYTNAAAMVAAGWTAEDMNALKTAPRSRPGALVNGRFQWPLVDGYRLLYSLFTDEEKKMYTAGRNNNAGHSTTSPAQMDDATKALWNSIFAKVKDDAESKEAFYKLCPLFNTDMPIFKLFADYELPAEPVTKEWIMFRKDGKRFEDCSIDRKTVLTAAIDDETVEQVMSVEQVTALIAEVPGAAEKVLM